MKHLALILALTACAGDETVSGYVDRTLVFTLESVDSQPFPAHATIAFPEEGEVSGAAPCNRWSASQTAPYPWVEIAGIRSTKRACADLKAETAFFDALRRMSLIEAAGQVVILSNDVGGEMVFRAE